MYSKFVCLVSFVLVVTLAGSTLADPAIAPESVTPTTVGYNYNSPNYSCDGSGFDATGLLHSAMTNDHWVSESWGNNDDNPTGRNGAKWIKYTLEYPYELDQMWVWNHNELGSVDFTDRGLKKVYIDYSVDDVNWTTLMDDSNDYFIFAQAPGLAWLVGSAWDPERLDPNEYAHNIEVNFGGVEAKVICITADVNEGNYGSGCCCGLGEVRFFGLTQYATNIDPADGYSKAPVDQVLSWTPGKDAIAHDVYFGTDAEDVNSATDPNVLPGRGRRTGNTYDPDLAQGVTYYWRIDEVTPSQIYKGNVASFTVRRDYLKKGVVPVVTATSAPGNYPPAPPQRSCDQSGLRYWLHSSYTEDHWVNESFPINTGNPVGRDGSIWIQYAFDKVYDLKEMWVWNQNELGTVDWSTRGLKNVTIDYSTDGSSWTEVGHYLFNKAPGKSWAVPEAWPDRYDPTEYAHNTEVDLTGISAKHICITADVNEGNYGNTWSAGLAEVLFLVETPYATFHVPADGQPDWPAVGTVLSWTPGVDVNDVNGHYVYFSKNFDDVNTRNPAVLTIEDVNNFNPGMLDLNTKYYWCVDEVNSAHPNSPWNGDVVSFTTQEYVVVDDMEDYNSVGPPIYTVWIETGGAWLGPEYDTVHEGEVSMLFGYSGSSEATRTLGQENWTDLAKKALVLFFYGDPGNTGGPMSVTLTDSDDDVSPTVSYPDSNDLAETGWKIWNIDLEDFNVGNMDLDKVKTIQISFGGGSGFVLIDDIRLYTTRCVPELSWPGDIDGDCVVNANDVDIMMGDWLDKDYLVQTVAPDANRLVGHWKFDEGSGTTAADSSGSGNTGTLMNMEESDWVTGISGTALSFDGVFEYVDFGDADEVEGLTGMTLSMWVQFPVIADAWDEIATKEDAWYFTTGPTGDVFFAEVHGIPVSVESAPLALGQWYHVAFTWDGTEMAIFVDGVEQDRTDAVGSMPTSNHPLTIAARRSGGGDPGEFFRGKIDEVRIYDYALSRSEVLDLAGVGEVYYPLISAANIYDAEPKGQKIVNFRDYALLANDWLKAPLLWP